jgi:TetR/AcrR family transcriptional regulator
LSLAQPRSGGTESRREILRVAEETFARKGYSGSSTREIAEAAGVTKGLLFYHFQTKERLYLTVIENMIKAFRAIVIPPTDGVDRIDHVRRFVDGYTDLLLEHSHIQKLIARELMDEGKFHRKIIDEYLKPLYDFGVEFLKGGIAEGVFRNVDPFTFIQMIAACNTMYVIALPLHERLLGQNPLAPEVLARRKEELARNFIRLIRKD